MQEVCKHSAETPQALWSEIDQADHTAQAARHDRIHGLLQEAELLAFSETPSVVDLITEEIEAELRFEISLFRVIRRHGSRHAQRVVDEAIGDHELIRLLISRIQRKEEDLRRQLSRLRVAIGHHFREQRDVIALAKACHGKA